VSPLLQNQRAWITGGSRGLGRALCTVFAAQGAKVAFYYGADAEGAEATLAQCGPSTRAFHASVLDESALNRIARELESEWGGIDILVNNAGISQPLPLALLDEADWDSVMAVNAKGPFLATRAAARGMIRRKHGVILNIGSLAGLRLIESPVHYAASKAALKGYTQALAKELGRYNIRVNCLAPGLLEDGVGRSLPEHRLQEYLRHVPLKRLGTLTEVAELAAFLVSDRNTYMHGETVLADGGL